MQAVLWSFIVEEVKTSIILYCNLYVPNITAIKQVQKVYSTIKMTCGCCTKGNEDPFGSKAGLAVET